MRKALLLSVLVLLSIPSITLAANTTFLGPIVPECARAGTSVCQACDLVKLADNLLKFMVAFSVFGAALMFAYAGFLYVTAATSKGNLDKARKVFSDVFIGLIIVLVAWIVVDLVLRTFTNQSLNVLTSIRCASYNPTSQRWDVGDLEQDQSVEPAEDTAGGTGTANRDKGLGAVDSNTNYNPFQCTVISLDYHECKDTSKLSARGKQECVQGCEYSSNGKPIVTVQDVLDCQRGKKSPNPHLSCSQIKGVTVAAPQDSGIPKGTRFTWPELARRYGLPENTVFIADDRYSNADCSKPSGCKYGHPSSRPGSYSVDVARCGEWNKSCSLPSFGSQVPMKTKPTPVPGG